MSCLLHVVAVGFAVAAGASQPPDSSGSAAAGARSRRIELEFRVGTGG